MEQLRFAMVGNLGVVFELNYFFEKGERMFVKGHGLHKLKIRLYTKLVSNLVDCCFISKMCCVKIAQ